MTSAVDFVQRLMNSSWESEEELRKEEPKEDVTPAGSYEQVLIEKIHADDSWNSRSPISAQEDDVSGLAESIRIRGLIHPITLAPTEQGYDVIAGFRRLRAIKKLGWTFVPAIVIEAEPAQARLINLAENIARKDLRLYDAMRTAHLLSADYSLDAKRIARETSQPVRRVKTMLAVWPQLSPFVKEKWSRIPDACWEPELTRLERWSHLSRPEQDKAWKEWCSDIDDPGSEFDLLEEAIAKGKGKVTRGKRRTNREVRQALGSLGTTPTDNARKRVLLWVLGRRESF